MNDTKFSHKGALFDIGKITRKKEALELTTTNSGEAKFKFAFNSQLKPDYRFCDIHTVIDDDCNRQLNNEEKYKLYKLLGNCIDNLSNMSITDVENKYFRNDDSKDLVYDPVGDNDLQMRHFCVDLQKKNKFRIHGYFNQEGYFVVVRMDWCHKFHPSKKIKA